MNVPTIGISYEPKIDGFMEMMNMTSVCTYENISVDKVLAQVEEYMKNGKKVDYSEKTKQFASMGQETLNQIIEELEIS